MTNEADAIRTKVNRKLTASMARILAADDGPPRAGDKALDEFLELVIYGNEVPAVANFLHEFYNSGSGVIRLTPNVLVAEGTVGEVFRHDFDESLKKCLLACRAGYFVYRDGQWLNGHDESFEMFNEYGYRKTCGLIWALRDKLDMNSS